MAWKSEADTHVRPRLYLFYDQLQRTGVSALYRGWVRFQFEQSFFSLYAPTVAAHVSALSDHAMTRNRNGHRVGRAGSGHSSRGGRLADCLRHRGVRSRCPERNGLQMRPHAPLKRCRLNIQGECAIQTLATHLTEQVFFPRTHGVVVASSDCEGKLMFESLLEFVVGIGELDGANSLVGSSD